MPKNKQVLYYATQSLSSRKKSIICVMLQCPRDAIHVNDTLSGRGKSV